MPYTLLRGNFVIRYPDLPRQGPEPDGDTVKFLPDTPALVEALPRRSGIPPDINARGISVRLEAIDALETHFGETHQELVGANAARDELLRLLGFTNVVFFDDQPDELPQQRREPRRVAQMRNVSGLLEHLQPAARNRLLRRDAMRDRDQPVTGPPTPAGWGYASAPAAAPAR
jgi:hypothetical protein